VIRGMAPPSTTMSRLAPRSKIRTRKDFCPDV
jgi:hypothetical protein